MLKFIIVLVVLWALVANAQQGSCAAGDGTCSNPDSLDFDNFVAKDSSVPKNANSDGRPREADRNCVDRYPDECAGYAQQGECQKNPGWMTIYCAKSCDACHLRDPKIRCDRKFLNMSTEPIYRPGDLNKMFESIVPRYSNKYDINIISTDPWIVTIDNFISDSEIKALLSSIKNWERSTDTGSMNEFGESGRILSNGRTSSNSWCTRGCEEKPLVQRMLKKIEDVTNIPKGNYESFQVLRYEIGQKYTTHHDFGYDDNLLACGPRILTFFLYLSDVEEGGETAFPTLGISVKPKKGRALLWPSVLDSDLTKRNDHTFHEAKPVIKGTKYAANSWIHLYNYEIPNLWGCTGSFDEL